MFGERLKLVLQRKDISQVALSKELGLTSVAVNRWCNGITQPDNDTIVKIANYLDVSTDFLLGNDKKNNKYKNLENELLEIEILKNTLKKIGYMKDDEDISKEELDKLLKFVNANKEFLKND